MPSSSPRSTSGPSVRARWRPDVRLCAGIALVLASAAGVSVLVLGAQHTEPVYVVTSAVAVGQKVEEGDLSTTQVRLGSASSNYLAPGFQHGPWIASRHLAAGELVPLSALTADGVRGVSALVVEPSGPPPSAVGVGTFVDLWVTPKDSATPPHVIADDVEVTSVHERDAFLGSGGVTVEVLVPEATVARVLAAIAAQDAIAVVAASPR